VVSQHHAGGIEVLEEELLHITSQRHGAILAPFPLLDIEHHSTLKLAQV
jgi:hypothetical protein